jgi:hypothetical protein
MTGGTPRRLDLRRQYQTLYRPSARAVELVDVPELLFLAIDGRTEAGVGPGESEEFAAATAALYGLGYGLKFMSKQRRVDPINYTVMGLEGLWSTESGIFEWGRREPWLYTLIMMQPDHIDEAMLAEAVAQIAKKRPNPAVAEVRLQRWEEGPSLQVMHIGPYSEEPRSLDMLDRYAAENGLEMHGRHHEIYLGDPRKAKPENLKTILRHPVKPPA